MQNSNWKGHKAKELAATVNKCFNEIVGNPPNDANPYNSIQDIIFIRDSLNAMIGNYLKFKNEKMEGIVRAECLPPIELISGNIERVLSNTFNHPGRNRRKRNRRKD